MYPYENDVTRELPTVNQHPVPRSPIQTGQVDDTYRIPPRHRTRARYDDPSEPHQDDPPWWRRRSLIAVGLSFVAVLVLGTAGGVLGVTLGVLVAVLIGRLAAWPILISPPAVALALAFSGAVGLIFGVYPARRAARLDPIVALRHE